MAKLRIYLALAAIDQTCSRFLKAKPEVQFVCASFLNAANNHLQLSAILRVAEACPEEYDGEKVEALEGGPASQSIEAMAPPMQEDILGEGPERDQFVSSLSEFAEDRG